MVVVVGLLVVVMCLLWFCCAFGGFGVCVCCGFDGAGSGGSDAHRVVVVTVIKYTNS